jgi:hypothetical protein
MTAINLSDSSLKKQVGGDHYKLMKMQPVEFILANDIDFCTGNIIKYVTRDKGDKIENLRKARHYIDILIEHHGGRADVGQ